MSPRQGWRSAAWRFCPHCDMLSATRQHVRGVVRRMDGIPISDESGMPRSVARALRLVRARLGGDAPAPPRLAEMAAAAGVSPRSLQRDFARVLGLSPSAAVLRLRLEAARQTLAGGQAPSVLAAALRHGFDHPGRFAIAYRRAFGQSPSATLRGAGPPPPTAASGTMIELRPLAPGGAEDAPRARRATDDLAIAITRHRDLVLAAPGGSAAQRLRLEGRVVGDEAVLSLLHPSAGSVLWMARLKPAGRGWADAAAAALATAVAARRIDQARRLPRHRADAETLFLRARPAAHALEPATVALAIDLLEEALHRDPTHARALALLGWSRAQGANQGFWRDPDAERARALDHGRRALALAADDPEVLTLAAGVMSLTRRLDEAQALLDRSLALDPNQPEAWRRRGFIENFRGNGAGGAAAFRRALRAWPGGNDGNMALIGLGIARFVAGDYAHSARLLARAVEEQPNRAWPYRFLTAAAVHAGARDASQRAMLALRRAFPDLTVDQCARSGVLHPEALRRVLEGLSLAGLPR